jgi:hypothetical protein
MGTINICSGFSSIAIEAFHLIPLCCSSVQRSSGPRPNNALYLLHSSRISYILSKWHISQILIQSDEKRHQHLTNTFILR